MILFLSLAFGLVLLALIFILPDLLSNRFATRQNYLEANIAATKQQLQAIDQEAEDDLVKTDQLKAIRVTFSF